MTIEKKIYSDNLESYDPYDIWKTKVGFKIKLLYNKNKYLGGLLAVIAVLFDSLNQNKRIFYLKQEYPVVRAYAALILLENKVEFSRENPKLKIAKTHIDWLIKNKAKGFKNYCWGINIKLPINRNLIYPKNTPYTTNTPYVLEAIIAYYKVSQEKHILEIIKSVYCFYEEDVKIMFETNQELVTSYGPIKDRIVVNAVSYTMYSYAMLLEFIPEKETYIKNKILKLYNFIKRTQLKDGSWYYAPLDNKSFIDCFHSCFVLKNILKTSKILPLVESDKIINNGYNYLKQSFFDEDKKLFRRFSINNKPSFIKWDLYDNSEMLNFSILMKDYQLSKTLNESIKKNFIKGNDVFSQINLNGTLMNKNTLRWAAFPYLYANSKFDLNVE